MERRFSGVLHLLAKQPERLEALPAFLDFVYGEVRQGNESVSGRIVSFDISRKGIHKVAVEDAKGGVHRFREEEGKISIARANPANDP
jgi:hypothetical protein